MKKLFAMFAAVFALALPVTMQAHEGFYAGAQGGVNWLDFKSHHHNQRADVGYLVGGVVGYEWCNNFSAEFEFTYRHNKAKRHHGSGSSDFFSSRRGQGNIHTWSFMANGYYDITLDCWCLPVSPYIGAGIGYDKNNHKEHRSSCGGCGGSGGQCNNGEFAWQVMAGLDYDLCWCGCDDIVLNVEYKFHESNGRHDRKFYDNSLTVGARKFF